MLTTSQRQIPYYQPADPADLAYITQAIAERLDAILAKRLYMQSIYTASLTNGGAVTSITIPAQPTATRILLRINGIVGFSGSANQSIGVSTTLDATATTAGATLTSQPGTQGVRCAESGQWYGYAWAGYVTLPANVAVTITWAMSITGGGNGYLRGDFVAEVLRGGEY